MRDTIPDRLTDPFLWARIRGAMLPVDAKGRSYALQLAEITGLTPVEAEALEDEYRRFLYIAALSAAPREPMGLLRRAWEYHAEFEGYLLDFCPWVLERHLPAVAVSKVSAPAHAAARIDYADEFGERPPDQYWGRPEPTSPVANPAAAEAPQASV